MSGILRCEYLSFRLRQHIVFTHASAIDYSLMYSGSPGVTESSARFVKILKEGRIAEAGTIGRVKRGSRVTGGENRPPYVLFCLVKAGLNILPRGSDPSANRALTESKSHKAAMVLDGDRDSEAMFLWRDLRRQWGFSIYSDSLKD
jgi:hypothetical protein